MPECNDCGTFVTPRFARVFGDNADDVYGCRNCKPVVELVDGHVSREGS